MKAFQDATGLYIHNIYGLTETTSPSHGVPARRRRRRWTRRPARCRSACRSPTRSCGSWATTATTCRAGEVGEIVTAGPQVVAGYWNKPEETAPRRCRGGALQTGDVGFMDDEGWFYIVDRKKDMINAAGYKVWPREVEDVLYEHPAVREAAVVGVPDEYRGETVKAFVSLRPGRTADAEELIAFCKERMAAYKYPRADRDHRRAAEDGHRQDPAPRAPHPPRRLGRAARPFCTRRAGSDGCTVCSGCARWPGAAQACGSRNRAEAI